MPFLRSCICRIRQPLFLALLLAVSIPPAFSQTLGRVENVQKENVLPLVSGVLQAHHTGLLSVETDTHDILSNYEEFRSHLMQYRARYRFHLEGTTLLVTMEIVDTDTRDQEARMIVRIMGRVTAGLGTEASSS